MRLLTRAPLTRWARGRGWALPVALFGLAAALRLGLAALVPFPTTEGSAYYVAVARNLIEGEGLVSHAIWSYATPPLTLPKPAFELWLPMTSFVAAGGMAFLGPTFDAAQVASALLGALLAPLTWSVAGMAARVHGLDERRARAVALAAGLLVAVLGPFLLAAAVPDSFTPYTVFTVASVLVAARLLGGHGRPDGPGLRGRPARLGVVLGVLLGLAYLSRQEAIWSGLAIVLLHQRAIGPGSILRRARETVRRLGPVALGGSIVVLPWLVRNVLVLGSPLPGQALENAVLRRNEDIFAFLDRPDLETYVAQGPATVVGNVLAAAWHSLVDVLLLPAFPVGLIGLIGLVGLRRSRALRVPTALALLLLSGSLALISTVLFFPVATRWGTFLHASGPILVALLVIAVMAGDALLARTSVARGWQPSNVVIAPAALLIVALPLAALQAEHTIRRSGELEEGYASLSASLAEASRALGEATPSVLISDHPVWLAAAVERSAVALPDEPVESLLELGRHFGTDWLVVIDERGRYPQALLGRRGRDCLAHEPRPLGAGNEPVWLFVLAPACAPA